MKIVVDTNRIIAALVKNGTAREILYNDTSRFASCANSLLQFVSK